MSLLFVRVIMTAKHGSESQAHYAASKVPLGHVIPNVRIIINRNLIVVICVLLSVNSLQVAYGQSNLTSERPDAVFLDSDPTWLEYTESGQFELEISDQVADGCWVSLSETETIVELELNRSGFEVVPEDAGLAPTIVLNAIGYEDGTGCVVFTELLLESVDHADLAHEGRRIRGVFFSERFSSGLLLSGPKNTMSSRVKDAFQSHTQELLVRMNNVVRNIEKDVLDDVEGSVQQHWEKYFESLR
jgi:hypothetical protein